MMIKKVMLSAFAFIPFMGFAQQVFNIKGEVGKIDAPAKVFLIYNEGGKRVIDSAEVKDGLFSFSGEVQQPATGALVLDREGSGLQAIRMPDMISLYIENGTISVKTADSLKMATLSGTPSNVAGQELSGLLKESNRKNDEFMDSYRKSTPEERNEPGFMDKMDERYNAIQNEINAIKVDFIKANPNSLVSLFNLVEFAGRSPEADEIEPLFAGLSKELRELPEGKGLEAMLKVAKTIAIGAIAPEFTQNDTLGNPVSLASFRGKYVLLDFWASWCGPCRQENPNIVAAYNEFKDKNFTILGISLDRENDREKWMKAIHDDKLAWTQVSDLKFWQNEVSQLYGISAIPQSFLLDPDGRIIAKNLRGKKLHEKLAELLN